MLSTVSVQDGAAAAFAQQAAAAAAAAVAAMAAGAQQPAVAPPMMGHLAVGAPAGGAGGVDPAAYGGMAGMGAGGMGAGGMGGHGAGVGGHVEEYVPEEDDGERFCICDRPSFGASQSSASDHAFHCCSAWEVGLETAAGTLPACLPTWLSPTTVLDPSPAPLTHPAHACTCVHPCACRASAARLPRPALHPRSIWPSVHLTPSASALSVPLPPPFPSARAVVQAR